MKKGLSVALSFTLVFGITLSSVFFSSGVVKAADTKITLTTSMITNEGTVGNPTALVDEQSTAGDPANGSGGTPTTNWVGTGSSQFAYIDLRQNYNLTNIYVRDTYGVGDFIVSSGSPGSWTTLFTDPQTNFMGWNSHPVSVTTRYVRVNLVDGGDVTEIVLYGLPTGGGGGGDTTAPGANTNLTAGTATSSSVPLTWTGTGDDGTTGTPASYDVRYSTSTITSGNWASATQATGEPAAAAVGTALSMTVSGLSPATTYYFALKTSDEVPNISALSNVVSKATAVASSSSKLTLTTSMVTNESTGENPTALVDEQSTAGDPATGSGGAPTTNWVGTCSSQFAYIDLGQNYNLTNIYVRDTYGAGDFIVSSGSPGSWTTLFTDPQTNYMTWNSHPVSVTTRYVRVNLVNGGDVTEIVLYGSPTGGGGSGDTTAPGANTNLAAGTATSSSVQLTWTGTGDDGTTGTPASYDVRYSTSTITSGNWATATQAAGEPATAVAGTSRSMTVSGLLPGTTYYFALKTSDEVPNISALSNVVSKATTTVVSGIVNVLPSMYINESGNGDPSFLTNEQSVAGDPKAGSGGTPSIGWDVGSSIHHPPSAVIDLGANYALTDLYLYDSNGTGNVKVSTGTPFSWNLQFTDGMTNFNAWNGHTLAVTTRYIQIIIESSAAMPELVLYGTALGTPAPTPAPVTPTLPTMDQLIGINAFIDDPLNLIQVAGFVREYHPWGWDEGDGGTYPGYPNNQNKFNPSWAGGGWNFDGYYSGLKNAGVTVSPVYTCTPSWVAASSGCVKPIKDGSGKDPLLPASYIEHADHMYQVAARYGSTVVADNKLKLASGHPRSTGLNTIKYFEDWNEQDAWWAGRDVYFSAYEYAAMASADYDGHQGTMGATIGMKNADPNAKMAMGGLADPNLSTIKTIKFWSDFKRGGSVPFDALNIHHYSNGASQTSGTTGISPEADNLVQKLKEFTDYRDRYMQGKEVWITEFGYDTNQGSPLRAPSIGATSEYVTQANWLVRSYLAASAAGIHKAAMYMLRDTDSGSYQQFATSGLTTSQFAGQVPKVSWYYVYTLKNSLTGMRFVGEESSGNSNVKIYKYKSATGNNGGYVVWAPTSNNTTVSNYQLSLTGTATTATKVTLTDGDTDGVSSSLSIASNKVTLNVSETPTFVLVNNIQ